jgi:endonuclease/exonuclease/phosphatase family metal-dependent hydrolase
VTLRIASYNIRRGGVGRRAPILDVLAGLAPDVVVLQEATDPSTVDALADELGFAYRLRQVDRSVAILGRSAPERATWHLAATGRTVAAIDLPGGARLIGVHLTAGLSQRGERRRLREVAAILGVASERGDPERTAIVGDLNAVAAGDVLALSTLPRWIRAMLRIDGGIGTQVVSGLRAAGYTDAYRRLHEAGGATMPSHAPVVRLDYAMLGARLVPALVSCEVGSDPPGTIVRASDHLPIVVELDLAEAR